MGHFMRAHTITAFLVFVSCAAPAGAATTSLSEFQSAHLAIQSKSDDQALASLADPATRKLVQAAFDTRVLDQIEWRSGDIAMSVCSQAAASMTRYLAPSALLASKGFNPASASSQKALYAYGKKYHDEQTLGMRFTIECAARLSEKRVIPNWSALSPEQRTNERRAGITQAQRGFADVISGALSTLAEPNFTAGNKLMILEALERNASAFGRAANYSARIQVALRITEVLPSLSAELRTRVTQIGDTISSTSCTALCM
jgi:hypothetical protein